VILSRCKREVLAISLLGQLKMDFSRNCWCKRFLGGSNMTRSTKHSDWQYFSKSSLEEGVKVPLDIAMTLAEGQKRLQIRQIDVTQAAISENSQYCRSVLEKMADSDYSGMFHQWSALCQNKAQRYGDLANECMEIMLQSAAEINHLISGSLSGLGTIGQSNWSEGLAPANERRVSAKIISFPDRRITSAMSYAFAGKSGRQHAA